MKKIAVVSLASALLFSVPMAQAAVNVQGFVAKKAAILGNMHKKASKALVNAAQDESYASFLAADAHGRHEHKPRIDQVSLNVQEKFHVEEMCLIAAEGPELARIVGKEIATDLSEDESGAVFFKPGFDSKPRTAIVSPIYMSPDANKWVLAYVTPVLVGQDKKAILHYEHGLDVYQDALNKGVEGVRLLAVSAEGYIISDSDAAIAVAKTGEKEEQTDYFQKFNVAGLDLTAAMAAIKKDGKLGGQAAAFKDVEGWTLIAIAK